MIGKYNIDLFDIQEESDIALCAIAKMENLYVREWVKHYQSLGFSHIYLYDNNDKDGEKFDEVISDYITLGYVTVIDKRGEKTLDYPSIQNRCYEECYRRYSKLHDWMAFFDLDEFLYVNKPISKILREIDQTNVGVVHVNLRVYDDNGLIHYTSEDVQKRFTHPASQDKTDGNNDTVKSIVKCKKRFEEINWIKHLEKEWYVINPHTPYTSLKVVDFNGNQTDNEPKCFNKDVYKNGYVKHFPCKTIEEYCKLKMKRLVPDRPNPIGYATLDAFWKYNNYSVEKEELAKKILNID